MALSHIPLAHLLCSLAAALCCAGCGSADASKSELPPGGGQTGEESFGCLAVERDAVALTEATRLGFSAEQVLAALGSERRLTLRRANGTTTSLVVSLAYEGGNIEVQDREYRSDDSAAEIALASLELAIDCDDILQLEVELRFSTEDGAFDEVWPVALQANSGGSARVYYGLDLAALNGTYQVTEVDPDNFGRITAALSLNLVGMSWSGSLDGQAESAAGASDDSSASAQSFSIATF
jgi:hypothetical protein